MLKKQAVKRVFYTVYEEYIIQYHIQKEGMLHPASNLIYSSFQGSEITTLPKAVEFAGFFHGMNLRNYRSPNRSDWVGHCIGKKKDGASLYAGCCVFFLLCSAYLFENANRKFCLGKFSQTNHQPVFDVTLSFLNEFSHTVI